MNISKRIGRELNELNVNDLLTPTKTLDNIRLNDYTIEIIGYVHTTDEALSDRGKHKFFKFVLSNNDGKLVSIVVWDKNIDRILQHRIENDNIIYLDGVKAKTTKAKDGTEYEHNGNVSYELHVRDNTAVCNLGLLFEVMPYQYTKLSDALKPKGPIVLKGYIKTNFAEYYDVIYNRPFGCGSITDGTYKLEVHIQKCNKDDYKKLNLLLDKGDKIEIKGMIETKRDRPPYLSINNIEDITNITQSEGHMPIASLLKGVQQLNPVNLAFDFKVFNK